jgi:hypothetical protein
MFNVYDLVVCCCVWFVWIDAMARIDFPSLLFFDVRMRVLSEKNERILMRISKRKEDQRFMKKKSREK